MLALVGGVIVGIIIFEMVRQDPLHLAKGSKKEEEREEVPPPGEALTSFGRIHQTQPLNERYRLVENVAQHATFGEKATGSSGMQWDMTWRAPVADDLAFVFTAVFDQGLIVGLSRTMTDVAGGYLIHILSPDAEVPGRYNFGISSIQDMWNVRVFHAVVLGPGETPGNAERTYWVRYQPTGIFSLGEGAGVGENIIFSTQYPYRTDLHNLPPSGIKYFGFGTSSPSCIGYREVVGVGLISSPLP